MSTSPITLDSSTLKPIGTAAASTITLDKSTLKPIQGIAPPKKGFFQGEPFIGSTGEALAQGMKEEGSPESREAAGKGALLGATLLVPGEALTAAIATRSIGPLIPLITSYLGAKFGYHAGKDVGGLVGEPEIGGKVGAVAGGIAGGMTGRVPTIGIRSLLLNLLKGGEEGETAAAATIKGSAAAAAEVPAAIPTAPAAPAATPAAAATPTASIVSGPETPEALHRFSNSARVRQQIMDMVKGNQ